MNRLFFILILLLSGCNHVAPVTLKFPEVPETMMVPPEKLKPLSNDNKDLSDLLDNANTNYGTYYKLSEQLSAWQEWYKSQKEIYKNIKE